MTTMMRRAKRLGLRAALALAAVVREQEQAERFAFDGAPDEFAPFGDEEFELLPMPTPSAAQFSHSLRQVEGVREYRRDFGSVQDFCEQPFANKQNEELFMLEEHGGKFDDRDARALRERDEKDGEMTKAASSNQSWYGAPSAQVAMERAYKGWPEGAELVRSMMDEVEAPPPVSLRRKVQHADQGDELDIHQVYRGGLDRAWSRRRRQSARSRMSVRLVAHVGGSRMDHADSMFWRGAAVAKLAEVLEESGYRVEIIGVEVHEIEQSLFSVEEEHGAHAVHTFVVKNAGSPMDLEQIVGVLCNAGFARTYGFRSAYTICEHALRPAQPVLLWDEPRYVRVKGRMEVQRVPKIDPLTGKQRFRMRRLLARTAKGGRTVEQLGLAADGTQTFSVPVSISEHGKAQAWVQECLTALEGGEQPADE